MQEIDQRDRELLGALQGEIPLSSTPFAVIGQMIDMSEKEVIKRTEKLKREGYVRAVAAQFDTRALGYRSCLVAAKVPPERIDDAAAAINTHPGVTQNYKRNNDFNLWFTIAIAPTSKLGLEKTVEILGGEADCDAVRALPTLKQFKNSDDDGHHSDEKYTPLTPGEIECIRLLQRDLPLQPRPFDMLASTSASRSSTTSPSTPASTRSRRSIRRRSTRRRASTSSRSSATSGSRRTAAPPRRRQQQGKRHPGHAS